MFFTGNHVFIGHIISISDAKLSKFWLNDYVILQLPPAPPPPAFPEGYVPLTAASEADKVPEDQRPSDTQPPSIDPIIDQGPAKRLRTQ